MPFCEEFLVEEPKSRETINSFGQYGQRRILQDLAGTYAAYAKFRRGSSTGDGTRRSPRYVSSNHLSTPTGTGVNPSFPVAAGQVPMKAKLFLRNTTRKAKLFIFARPQDSTLLKRIPGLTPDSIQEASRVDNDRYLAWICSQLANGSVVLPRDAAKLKKALHVFSIVEKDPDFNGDRGIASYSTEEIYELAPDSVDPAHEALVMDVLKESATFDEFYDNLSQQLGDAFRKFLQSVGGAPKLRRQWDTLHGFEGDTLLSLEQRRISPRLPFSKDADKGDDPHGKKRLQPDIAAWMKTKPAALEKAVAVFESYPGFGRIQGDTKEKTQQIIKRLADNLIWLYKQVPEEEADRSKLWYVGGNRLVHRWAQRFSVDPHKIAGVIAVLSPQRDWFQNVSLAERVLTTATERMDKPWDEKMTEAVNTWVAKAVLLKEKERLSRVRKELKLRAAAEDGLEDDESDTLPNSGDEEADEDQEAMLKLIPLCEGKTLRQVMGDPTLSALWTRAYDQAYNPRSFRVMSPEGEFSDWNRKGDKGQSDVTWSSLVAISKALIVLRTNSIRELSDMIGENHKLRSFYNNLIAPYSKGGDVTIDTHAVAAALIRPLSGSSREVSHNFGTTAKGGGLQPMADAASGNQGTYAVFADAYRVAAKKLGVQPRELQSITWEAVRTLFKPAQKRDREFTDGIINMWKGVDSGKSPERVRNQIKQSAGGFESPAWAGSHYQPHDFSRDSSYQSELHPSDQSGSESTGLPSGAGDGDPVRVASVTGGRVASLLRARAKAASWDLVANCLMAEG